MVTGHLELLNSCETPNLSYQLIVGIYLIEGVRWLLINGVASIWIYRLPLFYFYFLGC